MAALPISPSSWEERIQIVRHHFQAKGYRVHSGLQFGCELVLYADTPDRVHSDFCVHVVPPDGTLDWKLLQSLVRSMPDLHKTLILAQVIPRRHDHTTDDGVGDDAMQEEDTVTKRDNDSYNHQHQNTTIMWDVQEIAIATEHAPFRHKKTVEVGGQRKKQRR